LLSNEGVENVPLLGSRYYTAIDLFSVKTVADGYWLTAYYNKHRWQAFSRY